MVRIRVGISVWFLTSGVRKTQSEAVAAWEQQQRSQRGRYDDRRGGYQQRRQSLEQVPSTQGTGDSSLRPLALKALVAQNDKDDRRPHRDVAGQSIPSQHPIPVGTPKSPVREPTSPRGQRVWKVLLK